MEKTLQNLQTQFEEKAGNLKNILTDLMKKVDDGICWTEDDVTLLGKSAEAYQQGYLFVYDLVKKTHAESPNVNSSYRELLEMVKESDLYKRFQAFDALSELLLKFISVKARDKKYEAELLPFQMDARKLLETIEASLLPDEKTADEIEKGCLGPQTFMAALEMADLDSDEGIQKLDEVAESFPRRVEIGLTRGQYYLPEPSGNPEDEHADTDEKSKTETPADEGASQEASQESEHKCTQDKQKSCKKNQGRENGQLTMDWFLSSEGANESAAQMETPDESLETERASEEGTETGVDASQRDAEIVESQEETDQKPETEENQSENLPADETESQMSLTEEENETLPPETETTGTRGPVQNAEPDITEIAAPEVTGSSVAQPDPEQKETETAAPEQNPRTDEEDVSGQVQDTLHEMERSGAGEDSQHDGAEIHTLENPEEEQTGEEAETDGSQIDGSQIDGSQIDGSQIDESDTDKSEIDKSEIKESSEYDIMGLFEASNLRMDPDEWIGDVQIHVGDETPKIITLESFNNDILKGDDPLKTFLLQYTARQQYVTLTEMTKLNLQIGPTNRVLEFLMNKGYLVKVKLVPGGTFYVPGKHFQDAAAVPEIVDQLGIASTADLVMQTPDPYEQYAVDASAALMLTMVKLGIESRNRLSVGKTGKFATEMNGYTAETFAQMFCVTGNNVDWELNIGSFIKYVDPEKWLRESVKKMQNDNCHFVRVTSAGFDFERAKRLYDLFYWLLGDRIETDEVYLYSFKDDMFRKYEGEVPERPGLTPEEPEYVQVSDEEPEADRTGDYEETAATAAIVPDNETIQDEQPARKEPVQTRARPQPESEPEPEPDPVDPGSDIGRIYTLLDENNFYAASAYARVTLGADPNNQLIYQQMAYALHDPMVTCSYTSDHAFTMIERHTTFEDALILSIAIRAFFLNQVQYDYNLRPFYGAIKEYALLNEFPSLSKVIYSLVDFKDTWKTGMDAYADYHSRSRADLEAVIRSAQADAQQYYESIILTPKKESTNIRRFVATKKILFSVNGDYGQIMKMVADGDANTQPLVVDFLRKHFFADDSIISEDTLDQDMTWAYIMEAWDIAGEMQGHYKRFDDLKSHLRSNITSTMTRGLLILIRWCNLIDQKNKNVEEAGAAAYRRERGQLLENIGEAVDEMKIRCKTPGTHLEVRAGLSILIRTLDEIRACLDGSYNETAHRYYYVPFLLEDVVLLDENYLPDFDMHGSDLAVLEPKHRIISHVEKLQEGKTYEMRLVEILEERGDDYGSAGLIVRYLKEKNPAGAYAETEDNIRFGETYARQAADLRRDDFVGELELAQSYGQIDNSVEDKKEKILQIADAWYEWAQDTWNYGFFNRVLSGYLADIREEAKPREKDLLEQLEAFRTATVQGIDAGAKERRIARIQDMIRMQNYTVAEDLLARPLTSDEDAETLIEEDFLREFLDNYDDYYQPVASQKTSLANLLNKRTHNKEERGSKRMVENWLPGGSALGKERLQNLLTCFGFTVESVQAKEPIGKFEHFLVKTKEQDGTRRGIYVHPIAAFGSGAAREGFRVVCLNGAYDADSLVDVMLQIGNAKHTMILLDYALSISERRRLARKTKNLLENKLFIVIDRVLMMFMVRNYDETRNNRMLISLTVPFGYYQPYVWESANVMPPEIFIGRKRELEQIKSPTGVNIVYGGRQLGKSALLKKAKEEIDRDENGNRAVLVEIKGLGRAAAARKIGQALYDEQVLNNDPDTGEWDVLARAIRRRLQSTKDEIPYLLLLLDEADAFIESCSEVNYQPLDALKEVQGVGTGRFKFVIAGLRNVIRFKREALENNSVLTHLEAMTVKPFSVHEARELMEIPLFYLGLRFPEEKAYLITLILATTNYFPGLIQMYCAKLVNAMRDRDYAKYNEVDTPIYKVSEDHIKRVLSDPDFTSQIREKFLITLKLDEDNDYYLIALLLAYLYHTEGHNEGYTPEEIRQAGETLDIRAVARMDSRRVLALMQEMEELNVLRRTDDTRYLFTRFAFFQMMGTRSEVEDKLTEYMGE